MSSWTSGAGNAGPVYFHELIAAPEVVAFTMARSTFVSSMPVIPVIDVVDVAAPPASVFPDAEAEPLPIPIGVTASDRLTVAATASAATPPTASAAG